LIEIGLGEGWIEGGEDLALPDHIALAHPDLAHDRAVQRLHEQRTFDRRYLAAALDNAVERYDRHQENREQQHAPKAHT
jgi:hypothetical protein